MTLKLYRLTEWEIAALLKALEESISRGVVHEDSARNLLSALSRAERVSLKLPKGG